MKYLAAFVLCLSFTTSPARAWDFTPFPICTLTHSTEKGEVTLTFDPAGPEYTITLRFVPDDLAWPEGTPFGMEFLGGQPVRIGTDRQVLSDDRRSLTVTDTGFGNVLDGLEFNAFGEGRSGDASMQFSLADAAGPVARFRACEDGAATS